MSTKLMQSNAKATYLNCWRRCKMKGSSGWKVQTEVRNGAAVIVREQLACILAFEPGHARLRSGSRERADSHLAGIAKPGFPALAKATSSAGARRSEHL